MFKVALFLIISLTNVFAQNLLDERLWKIPARKKSIYMKRGIFHTGNKKVQSQLKSIRHSYSAKTGYERFVFDFTGNEVPKIYGHISSKDGKLYVDFFDTSVNPEMSPIGNSRNVASVNFFPVSADSLSLELNFKRKVSIDVFHLSNPARLVVDMR